MSKRNRATVGYLLEELREIRNKIDEAIDQVDSASPDQSFTCKGCGHSDWEHTNFAGGCIATKPCDCTRMGIQPIIECKHITSVYVNGYGPSSRMEFAYCPRCGNRIEEK